MRLPHFSCFILILLFLSLSGTSFAQSKEHGFDIKAGLNFSAVVFNVDIDSGLKIGDYGITNKDNANPKDDMVGIGGSVSVGYRWKYAGIYLDHTIGGLWWLGETADHYDESSLLMAWFVSAHGFFPIGNKFEIEGALGIGGALSDGDRPYKGDGTISPNYGKPAIILDNHGNPAPCLALHFGVGLTYYLTRYIGIGAFFDYNLMINTYKYEYNYGIISANANVTRLLHQINPGIQAKFRFY